jgi:hypothetical protein
MDDLDHRNLGVNLKLWHLQEDAPGMVFWHPRGYAVYRVLEDYVRRKMRRAGYAEVRTPQLLPHELWGRSGHWDKFGEHMFRVDVPLAWFPRLLRATRPEREQVELSRVGLHWEALNEDISIAGLLAGRGDVTRSTEHAAWSGTHG